MSKTGRRRGFGRVLPIVLGLFILFSSTASAASAVLGIDLGTEYIKAALVKPGIPLEIVLSKDSKRKEPSAVAFKSSKSAPRTGGFPERLYGGDALALAARFPGDVYPNLKSLLGVSFEGSDALKQYKLRYPSLMVVKDADRPTIAFKSGSFVDGEGTFSVEELLAMELKNIKENAIAMAGKGTDVSEVVFTVPPYYTADERRALEVAANLAGLKVLGLVSDGLAVGIHYATSRTFPDISKNESPEHHMVFDMGAGSASATILKLQSRSVKDVGRFNKTVQEVLVVGAGWDRTLGGDALNGLIVDDMVLQFAQSPAAIKASIKIEDIKTHGRTNAKLWKDAEKVRQVLSANNAMTTSFESLYEEVDFKYKITRRSFEDMAASFADRVDGPIAQALAAAGLIWKDLDSVILHGGAVRTPFIQKRLESLAGGSAKLKTNVNADEAAVFGAAFKAAGLSPSFRVKEIRDNDTTGYSIGVQYMWNLKDRLQNIFTPTSKIGTAKEIPFKMMGEFEFTLYQTIPSGREEPDRSPVVHVKTGNMTRSISKLIDSEGCDRDSINTSFAVRINPVNGIPEVLRGWVHCEVDTIEKKGGVMDGVKGLFGFGSKDGEQKILKDEGVSEPSETLAGPKLDVPSAAGEGGSESSSPAKEEPSEPVKRVVSSNVTFEATSQGYERHLKKDTERMNDRLKAFDDSDTARRVREELYNSLEAYTYKVRDLLEEEDFAGASTTDLRSKLGALLEETSEWLYGEGIDATKEVLKAKTKALKDLVEPIQTRLKDAVERPEQIKLLQEALNQTQVLINGIKESMEKAAVASKQAADEATLSAMPSEGSSDEAKDPFADLEEKETPTTSTENPNPTDILNLFPYSEEDLKDVSNTYESVKAWLEEKVKAQEKLAPHEDAVLKGRDVAVKAQELNTVVMSMIQKQLRIPKQPKSRKSKTSRTKAKKPKTTSTESADEEAKTMRAEDSSIEKEKEPIDIRFSNDGKEPSEEDIEHILAQAREEATRQIRDEL